jgi:hypothetical protein
MNDIELLEKIAEQLDNSFNENTDFEGILEVREEFRDFIMLYIDIKASEKARIGLK